MTIYDADTNVPFPFGDKRLDLIKQGHKSGAMAKDPWTTTLFSWLRDVAKITRGLRELPFLGSNDIERMVTRAQTQWTSYPLEKVFEVDDPTSTSYLVNYMLLQDSMLLIHRHNLSPLAPMNLRINAMRQCLQIALSWIPLIKRCVFDDIETTTEQKSRTHRFKNLVLPEFCLHLWRLQLLLFAGGLFQEAVPLTIASKAIGNHRPVNLELPKYVAGMIRFVDGKGSIYEHAENGGWTVIDEEIIAFAVGDLHGMYRGRGFPEMWDRPGSTIMPSCTANGVDGEVKDEEMVTWSDVLDLVKIRAMENVTTNDSPSSRSTVPNPMAIQNLI